jgi:excisionase family DNA binding protein
MSTDPRGAAPLLTISDVADLLNVSISSVRRLQQARRLRFFKVGRNVRFSKQDVDVYLDARHVETVDQIKYGSTKN